MTRRFERGNDLYTIAAYPDNNGILTVSKNGVYKTVRIVDDLEFTYKCLKTRIRARNGAAGLYGYICKTLDDGFGACLAWRVLDHVVDTMRAV